LLMTHKCHTTCEQWMLPTLWVQDYMTTKNCENMFYLWQTAFRMQPLMNNEVHARLPNIHILFNHKFESPHLD
jgi:hypothetical protein